jgi:alpha,alpha-trehalose phosphorylase
VSVRHAEATYELDGETAVDFTHHGEPVRLEPGAMVALTMPEIVALTPRPEQPAGRQPQRRPTELRPSADH